MLSGQMGANPREASGPGASLEGPRASPGNVLRHQEPVPPDLWAPGGLMTTPPPPRTDKLEVQATKGPTSSSPNPLATGVLTAPRHPTHSQNRQSGTEQSRARVRPECREHLTEAKPLKAGVLNKQHSLRERDKNPGPQNAGISESGEKPTVHNVVKCAGGYAGSVSRRRRHRI